MTEIKMRNDLNNCGKIYDEGNEEGRDNFLIDCNDNYDGVRNQGHKIFLKYCDDNYDGGDNEQNGDYLCVSVFPRMDTAIHWCNYR